MIKKTSNPPSLAGLAERARDAVRPAIAALAFSEPSVSVDVQTLESANVVAPNGGLLLTFDELGIEVKIELDADAGKVYVDVSEIADTAVARLALPIFKAFGELLEHL